MDTAQIMERIYNQSMKYHNFTDLNDLHSRMAVTLWAISCLAFPILCAAMYGLYRLIKSDHVAPVYVINLLMSDMLQICTNLAHDIDVKHHAFGAVFCIFRWSFC